MPFGKHKNRELEDIPADYLLWVLDNVETLSPTLRAEINRVLAVGKTYTWTDPPRQDLSLEIVNTWYRRLSKEFHPDLGGSHEGMKAINRGREIMLELLKS